MFAKESNFLYTRERLCIVVFVVVAVLIIIVVVVVEKVLIFS